MFGSFLIVGDHLDPDEAVREIALDPSRSWRIGDPHVWPSGRVAPPRRTSAWIYELPPEQSVEMPALIDRLLDRLEPSQRAIVSLLRRTGAKADHELA